MKLVIAEKPSVAQSLAAVIGATARKDGYLRAAAGGSAGVWAIWLVWPTPTLITRTTPSGAMTICPFCRNPGRWW